MTTALQSNPRQLAGVGMGIEGMVQRKRAAGQQPRNHPGRQAGKGGGHQCRQQHAILLQPAFEHHGESARDQLGMTACNRNKSVRSDIPRDDCQMASGSWLSRALFSPGGSNLTACMNTYAFSIAY
jgi:hypothetical protein